MAGGPVRWGTPPADRRAAPADGLDYAYRLTQWWLSRHPDAAAPVVLHAWDGVGCEDECGTVRRSLEALTDAAGGRVAVVDWLLDDDDPADWFDRAARPRLDVGPANPPAPGPVFAGQKLWAPRQGNADAEWEDGFAVDERRGRAAVADGASEGIFARAWARLLCERLVTDWPDLTDADARTAWVAACSRAWFDAINYPTLRPSQQRKVDEVGSGATLLALEVVPRPGRAAWRAWAVGDACLFWARGRRLLAGFPLLRSGHFTRSPALIRTTGPVPAPLVASGVARRGDLFVLATDAVAAALLRESEAGGAPAWDTFATVALDAWRADVDRRRAARPLVNDDCTLLALRVAGGSGCSD